MVHPQPLFMIIRIQAICSCCSWIVASERFAGSSEEQVSGSCMLQHKAAHLQQIETMQEDVSTDAFVVEAVLANDDCADVWEQCGGTGWEGPHCCASGSHCVPQEGNEWYSQCLPDKGPSPPAPGPAPLPVPANGGTDTGTDMNWDERELHITHYWDCSGQGCDATVLQPWDPDKFVTPAGYMPQNPQDFGGPSYGERLWLTGAASDALAQVLGDDDGRCGHDEGSGGCGKCLLIQNPDAVNADWTAVIMKKNRCPPWSHGCEEPHVHFDVAVPGFDNLQFSTANICGEPLTGFQSKKLSAAAGSWYEECGDTAACAHLCDELPSDFAPGCRRFAAWGWTTGAPTHVRFRPVACPEAFVKQVAGLFGAAGPTDS